MRLTVLALFCLGYTLLRAELPVATHSAPAELAPLLARYVTPSGVRYEAWKATPADVGALGRVTAFYADTRPPADRNAALAWHLNAYNSGILRQILDAYPVPGPLALAADFFSRDNLVISGRRMSFDHLEKQLIRPTFQEPRVHFALNCASRSCPPLASRPFDASTLEQDLDTLTRAFVNDHPQGVTFQNSTLRLSRVFDWYRDDFASAGGIIAFLNRHRTQLLPPNTKLNYFEYDWSLNSAP